MLTLYQAALFNSTPQIGSRSYDGEVSYTGYKRVSFVADERGNLAPITFPPVPTQESVVATHIAVIDGGGVIVNARQLNS